MSDLALTLLVALVTAAVVSLAWWLARRPGHVDRRLRQRVIVTTKAGAAFDGLLFEADRTAWFLRDASALRMGEANTNLPVDGEVVILTSEIAYAQRP